jgi:HEAT repeat protein
VATIGNLDLVPLVPDLSRASARPELLTAVRETLAKILAGRPVKDVMTFAGTEDILVRELAVLALVKTVKELQGPKQQNPVLDLLEQRMKDKELVIRQAAVQALFEIGGEANWNRVLKGTADPDPKIRILVVDAALAMASEAGDAVISEKLDDETDEVRIRAITAVRERKIKTARPKLKQFVGSRNRDQKLETLRAIVTLNETQEDHREFFEIYKSSLYLLDPDVQLAAIQGIQYIVDPMVVPLLQSNMLLGHSDPRIRAATIQALGRSRDFNTIEDIARGFADPELLVQEAAIEALRLMGNKRGVTPLQEFVRQTPDDALRVKAEAAIEEITNKRGLLGP